MLVPLLATVVFAAEPQLVALLDDGTLVVFRPGAESRTLRLPDVSGKLVGIDRRPADGKLYGIAGSEVYTVDPSTGAATLVSTLTVPFDGEARSGVDFTPQLDRLRLVSADGRNMRVNVAIGATAVDTPLAYAAGDPHAGTRPRITAAGYGNNRPDVATTTLFEIDSGLDVLVIQDPANDGVLKTVGPLGHRRPGPGRIRRRHGRPGAGRRVGGLGHGPPHHRSHDRPGDVGRFRPGAGRPVVSLAILDGVP